MIEVRILELILEIWKFYNKIKIFSILDVYIYIILNNEIFWKREKYFWNKVNMSFVMIMFWWYFVFIVILLGIYDLKSIFFINIINVVVVNFLIIIRSSCAYFLSYFMVSKGCGRYGGWDKIVVFNIVFMDCINRMIVIFFVKVFKNFWICKELIVGLFLLFLWYVFIGSEDMENIWICNVIGKGKL